MADSCNGRINPSGVVQLRPLPCPPLSRPTDRPRRKLNRPPENCRDNTNVESVSSYGEISYIGKYNHRLTKSVEHKPEPGILIGMRVFYSL